MTEFMEVPAPKRYPLIILDLPSDDLSILQVKNLY